MSSLRRTLLFSLLLGILSVSALVGWASYRTALAEIDALMDYQLRQLAFALRDQQFAGPFAERQVPPPEEALDFVIQIWSDDGVRLYLSHPHSVLPSLAQLGYDTLQTTEGEWRAFSVPLLHHVIQVAQPMKVRRHLAADVAWRTLMPMLAALPLLGTLIWWLVGRGLRPLQRLTRDIAQRRHDALDPLPVAGVPQEVRPLVGELNRLLERLGLAMQAQREFVADAAHELRTPLTALQIQLQLAERATDETTRLAALADLGAGLARATHLVEQMLTLARHEPGAGGATKAATSDRPVKLAELARQSLSDHAALARARGIDLGASQLDDALELVGDPAALRTLAGNLVDNAIRYTPAGGRVDVSVQEMRGSCQLAVDDSGPGVPPEDRQRVLDRFYRRPGSDSPGSGLGLAIVQRIAERHGARLELGNSALGGLRVTVSFPRRA